METQTEETQTDKRTVCPDAEAIKRLRLGKGWRTEDLAKNARCSVKTVENVERGAKVYLFTLAKLAKALGVEFMTLVQGGKPRPASPPPASPRPASPPTTSAIEVKIVLSIPFDQFDESEKLVSFVGFLQQLLGRGGEIVAADVESGSTVITLLMSVQDAIDLHSAYSQGKMKDMFCEGFHLVYPFFSNLDESSRKQITEYLLKIDEHFASYHKEQLKRDEKSRNIPKPQPQIEK
jgi:transcriptional regulator with XRE-family HTH domain